MGRKGTLLAKSDKIVNRVTFDSRKTNMQAQPPTKEYCCPSCGDSMVVGHVAVGASEVASLYWAPGKTEPQRSFFHGLLPEGNLIANTVGWRIAHLCSVCGIVTIDLEWDRCRNCEQLIPLSRADGVCGCGWSTKMGDLSLDEITRDEALATASRLDQRGAWDAAIALYERSAQRWPDQRDYINECLKGIKEKQALE